MATSMVRRKHSGRSYSPTCDKHMDWLPHPALIGTTQTAKTSEQSLERQTSSAAEDAHRALLPWLTWITEKELHQSVQQQIEHSTQEYHRYLETTYALRSLHHCEDNQVTEGTMIDPQTETATSPSFSPLKDEINEFTDSGCTWLDSFTVQPRAADSHIQSADTPASPVRAPRLRRSLDDVEYTINGTTVRRKSIFDQQ
jgi:hypothetical protein